MSTAPVIADADATFAAGKSKYVGNEIVPTDAVAWFNLTFIVWPGWILLASNLTFWLATNCKVKKLPFDKSILAVLELTDNAIMFPNTLPVIIWEPLNEFEPVIAYDPVLLLIELIVVLIDWVYELKEDVFNLVLIEFIKLPVADANCASVAYVASNEELKDNNWFIDVLADEVNVFKDAVVWLIQFKLIKVDALNWFKLFTAELKYASLDAVYALNEAVLTLVVSLNKLMSAMLPFTFAVILAVINPLKLNLVAYPLVTPADCIWFIEPVKAVNWDVCDCNTETELFNEEVAALYPVLIVNWDAVNAFKLLNDGCWDCVKAFNKLIELVTDAVNDW